MVLLGTAGAFAQSHVAVDFENLEPSVAYSGGGHYWNGPDANAEPERVTAWWGDTGTAYSGSFADGGVGFLNEVTRWDSGWDSWTGWAYSNITDASTAGFGNQCSAYVRPNGGGYGGAGNYAIYYGNFDEPLATVSGIPAGKLQGAYFTNTTYAALSMLNGDGFAKKFGHIRDGEGWVDTNDPDWLKLRIMGLDDLDNSTGSVDFYLADYRNEEGVEDRIVDQWTWVDLTPLGDATRLQFELTSSDTGPYGMNSPAYFAMDNLTYVAPEPSALVLLACGVAACAAGVRRGRKRNAV